MEALKSFSAKFINDTYQSLEEASFAVSKPDGPNVAYFIKKITGPMNCQDAAVLVGFYSSETASFNVKIGDTLFPKREVMAEHFVFAMEDSIIPLIKMVYHNVELITDSNNMYGLFACVPPDEINRLIETDVHYEVYTYSKGMFGIQQVQRVYTPKYEEFSDTEKFTNGFFIKKRLIMT